MKNFKTIPPKQKYMSLFEIHKAFGSRSVVAYFCKIEDSMPQGGFVIAVQNEPNSDSKDIKEYLHQFKIKYPSKEPVFYLALKEIKKTKEIKEIKETDVDSQLSVTYDDGTGEKQSLLLPKVEVKKSKAEIAMDLIPDEFIAKALSTILKMDEFNDKK